jgi:hypothetical protein
LQCSFYPFSVCLRIERRAEWAEKEQRLSSRPKGLFSSGAALTIPYTGASGAQSFQLWTIPHRNRSGATSRIEITLKGKAARYAADVVNETRGVKVRVAARDSF